MTGLRGSFLGFTYNGIHSSVVGITRTSHGNYNEERLSPLMKDITVENAGGDSSYHFGTLHTKREFVVNFCYESMTEIQKNQITKMWKDGEIHDLIFDEYPYKIYSAKITGNGTFKELAFTKAKKEDDEIIYERFYSGEGTFVFTSFSPYARSRHEYIEDYVAELVHEWASVEEEDVLLLDAKRVFEPTLSEATIAYGFVNHFETVSGAVAMEDEDLQDWLLSERLRKEGTGGAIDRTDITENGGMVFALEDSFFNNLEEWKDSSNLPSNNIYGFFEGERCKIYNAGDVAMPFVLWLKAPAPGEILNNVIIKCNKKELNLKNIKLPKKATSDCHYLVVDIEKNTIEVFTKDKKQTGITFNHCLDANSEFFYVPLGEQELVVTGATPLELNFHYLYY